MEELYDSGKAKAIGVTNFSSKKPQDLWDIAGVPPTVNQVECHPQWQQLKLHEFCASKEIHLSNPKANPKNVAIIILGEGAGTRLFPLTSTRAKQVVPIAGCYRIIDIPMSNCIKNGIRKVYVLTQFNFFYLNGHLCRSYNFGNGVNFGGGFVEDAKNKDIENILTIFKLPLTTNY
ncbi:hypothetical protein JHK87_053159 [Glycine soja]|nr:hypothetical protein JHK87_053159 [Glycine soja]